MGNSVVCGDCNGSGTWEGGVLAAPVLPVQVRVDSRRRVTRARAKDGQVCGG